MSLVKVFLGYVLPPRGGCTDHDILFPRVTCVSTTRALPPVPVIPCTGASQHRGAVAISETSPFCTDFFTAGSESSAVVSILQPGLLEQSCVAWSLIVSGQAPESSHRSSPLGPLGSLISRPFRSHSYPHQTKLSLPGMSHQVPPPEPVH